FPLGGLQLVLGQEHAAPVAEVHDVDPAVLPRVPPPEGADLAGLVGAGGADRTVSPILTGSPLVREFGPRPQRARSLSTAAGGLPRRPFGQRFARPENSPRVGAVTLPAGAFPGAHGPGGWPVGRVSAVVQRFPRGWRFSHVSLRPVLPKHPRPAGAP